MDTLAANGFESFKAAVKYDCDKDGGCFNEEGCNVQGVGISGKRCFHLYCDKFTWVVERAKHYGEKLGLDWRDILAQWEADRTYWYMNYYQESNQPEIKGDKVRVFETVDEVLQSFGKREFRCPACHGVSTDPNECNSGQTSGGKVCDWKSYGLFGAMGQGVFVYIKEKLRGQTIFMPLAWEVMSDGGCTGE